MRVIITGIGDTGHQLAEELSSQGDYELVLVERDEEKCEMLSQEVDALVIHGDGTEPAILEKAGAKEADVLVAATESDALNMVIAILGKRFSVPKVIVKLNKIDLRTTCQEIGIDHVISPTLSATMEIINLLRGHDILDFSLLIKGGIRLIEITPGEMAGTQMKDIDLPEKTLLIGILRDEIALIPQESTKLDENDILIVLAQGDEKVEQVKEIFGELKRTRRSVELDEAE
jgi:trk system potassium uptake protein TrkA